MWTLLEQNPGAVTVLNSDLRQLHRFVPWGHMAPMLHELRWLSNSVLQPKSTTRHFQPSNSSAGGLWCYYGANAMPSALCPKVSVPQCPDEGTDGGHHRFFLEFLTGFLPVEARVGSGGGEMHAGSLSNVLSGWVQVRQLGGIPMAAQIDTSCLRGYTIQSSFHWQRPSLTNFRGCFEDN